MKEFLYKNIKYFFVIIIPLFILVNYSNFSGKNYSEKLNNDSTITITVSVVGDLMCHSVQYNYAKVEKDSFDFNPVYREVREILSEADFTFGNLETVTAGKSVGYSGYPFFNTPDEFVYALKENGFDLLTTSNNHSLDQGEKGILRTIEVLKNAGIGYNGTYISETDRDSIRIFNINNIKIAFLAYTYGTNGIPVPDGKKYLINLIDFNLIKKDIENAKSKNPDLVLVHYHFGEEYKRFPTQYQKDVVDSTIKFGADIIIGGHPHVIQPAEIFKTNNGFLDSGIVAYSLGNFISNQQWRYSDAGVILNLEIKKNFYSDSVFISDINYLPTWVYKGKTERGREYIILPSENYSDSSYTFLSKSDRKKMEQAFNDTKEILTNYTEKIKLYKKE